MAKIYKLKNNFRYYRIKQKIAFKAIFCLHFHNSLLRDNLGTTIPKNIELLRKCDA